MSDTARTLSERFGKIVQLRESHSVSNENVTTSTNTQLETLIPASKISNLTQGMFVGSVADNFDEPIPQKIFHAEIVIDNEKVKAETAAYVPIPDISSFIGEDGEDHMGGGNCQRELLPGQGRRCGACPPGDRSHRGRPETRGAFAKEKIIVIFVMAHHSYAAMGPTKKDSVAGLAPHTFLKKIKPYEKIHQDLRLDQSLESFRAAVRAFGSHDGPLYLSTCVGQR